MQRKFFGAKLDPTVWKSCKVAAAQTGKAMYEFIEDALRAALSKAKKA